jgi:hypothetical protein
MVLEMPRDRVATGVQPLAAELLAELNDQIDRRRGDGCR